MRSAKIRNIKDAQKPDDEKPFRAFKYKGKYYVFEWTPGVPVFYPKKLVTYEDGEIKGSRTARPTVVNALNMLGKATNKRRKRPEFVGDFASLKEFKRSVDGPD